VTDANVVVGYMNPKAIAGSALQVDRQAAWDAIKSEIADPLGIDTYQAAYGITQIANSAMMRALRAVSTERGRDPRDFTLVSFGGAGPIHAAALAENMEITKVLVPVFPGLFSALGLLLADYRHDYIRSVVSPVAAIEPARILADFEEMKRTASEAMRREGVPAGSMRFEQYADLKYDYQLQELGVDFPTGSSPKDLPEKLTELFKQAHLQAFGYNTGDSIDLVGLRLRALASVASMRFSELAAKIAQASPPMAQVEPRDAYFGPKHGLLKTSIYRRIDITDKKRGPLVIEEPDTTVVVPPGWSVSRDQFGSLVLSHEP
jgi:N-methylhydantoinase A